MATLACSQGIQEMKGETLRVYSRSQLHKEFGVSYGTLSLQRQNEHLSPTPERTYDKAKFKSTKVRRGESMNLLDLQSMGEGLLTGA